MNKFISYFFFVILCFCFCPGIYIGYNDQRFAIQVFWLGLFSVGVIWILFIIDKIENG